MISPAWEASERYCLEVPERRRLIARIGEHKSILSACAAGDADRAAAALHDHLATTANHIAVAMQAPPLYEIRSRRPA